MKNIKNWLMISISPITTEHRRLKNKMESQIEVDGIDNNGVITPQKK